MIDGEQLARDMDAIDYSGLVVREDYLDANGHMNTGYYAVLMDRAVLLAFGRLGIGWTRIRDLGITVFSLTSQLVHHHEILLGQPLAFGFQLLDVDEKRVHFLVTMRHAQELWTAATYEGLSICVDMATRKSTRWPPQLLETLHALREVHRNRPVPADIGQPVGIRRRAGKRD